MNIVFLWDSDLNGNDDGGISLSGKYFVSYDVIHGILDIKRNDRYVDRFWDGNIQDCLAIVGNNGAGKTMLANSIMNDIRAVQGKNVPAPNRFVLVAEERDGELSAFYTLGLAMEQCSVPDGIHCKRCMISDGNYYLRGLKSAYFCNSLSCLDYMAESRCDYDFSLGRMIRRHQAMTREMDYGDLRRDAIWNYYTHEALRIIRFLYDDKFQRELEIDFPWPKRIQIRIADGTFNETYIVQETKALGESELEKEMLEREVRQFIRNVDAALQQFGRTWINYTVKNLILNCYKKLCIRQAVPDNSTIEPQKLLEALNRNSLIQGLLGMSDFCEYGLHMLEEMYEICWELDKKLDVPEHCVEQKFILWLEEDKDSITRFERRGMSLLDIPTGEETREFMQQLCEWYANTSFEFPFYDFSSGVSAGEYSFLVLFSNLYSMSMAKEFNVYDYQKLDGYTTSLLLIFDEADLSMHPRWQQMYIRWLTVFCEKVFQNRSLQLIVTTHSPILLSDFPSDSVLYVRKDEQKKIYYEKRRGETFGCNIHTLFLDSFFLQDRGTMGAFAEETINTIAKELLGGEASDIRDERLEQIKKTIACIGEGIIREKLELALERRRGGHRDQIGEQEHAVIRETLERLKEQRKDMDRLIKELEERLYD